MGIQDIAALTVAAGALAFVGRVLWRSMKGDGGCGCSHARRSSVDGAAPEPDSTGIRRQPLVTLGQVGRPYRSEDIDT